MAPKIHPVAPIESDKRLAAEQAILRKIVRGLQDIDTEIDSLNIEDYLGAQPPQERRGRPTVTRVDELRERLKKNRAALPAMNVQGLVTGDIPEVVALALEIIDGTRPTAPVLTDRRALIQQLKMNRDAIRKGRVKQEAIVNAISDELKYLQATSDQPIWSAFQLRRFRLYQQAAALADEEDDFRKSRIDAGFGPWRSDLMPDHASRVRLTLGSERHWDSEISRMRRSLEEAKIL